MAKIIRINTQRLGQDEEVVKQCIDKMKGNLEHMRAYSAQLDSMWDGPASETLKSRSLASMTNLENLINSLEEIYRYEDHAKDTYEKCGTKVDSIIAGIKV